jgi:hypothetical protein
MGWASDRAANNDVTAISGHTAIRPHSAKIQDWLVLWACALFALITAICPVVRAFYHFEINYVEGWDVYNVLKVVHHAPLYSARYAWTTVNYPVLSYYVVAYISRFTHDYLLAGRLLSLVSLAVSCVLIGLIIQKLTDDLAASFFGGFFCLALFCAIATRYVGMNNPQMFAQVFFLSGLLLYIAKQPTAGRIAAIALLFIVGGNIKHNLLEFPAAVFIDLCLISRRKAAQFALFSAVLLGASVMLNIKLGGPFFVSNLLSSRTYSLFDGFHDFLGNYWPILLPFAVACIWVRKNWGVRERRLICIFFIVSLMIDVAIAGGIGISINTYFGNFFAISIIMGMVLHDTRQPSSTFLIQNAVWRRRIPVILFASLLLPLSLSGYFWFWNGLKRMPEEQNRFDAEASFLRAQPGPAICESLLRCYYAGKEYVFDPFNGTRLARSHKLDSGEIVQKIATHQYAAIQLHGPVGTLERPNERFPNDVLDAIGQYYVLSLDDPKCAIYLPAKTQ